MLGVHVLFYFPRCEPLSIVLRVILNENSSQCERFSLRYHLRLRIIPIENENHPHPKELAHARVRVYGGAIYLPKILGAK